MDLDNTSSFVPAASTLADFENLSDSDWETDNMESITRMLNHLYFYYFVMSFRPTTPFFSTEMLFDVSFSSLWIYNLFVVLFHT